MKQLYSKKLKLKLNKGMAALMQLSLHLSKEFKMKKKVLPEL